MRLGSHRSHTLGVALGSILFLSEAFASLPVETAAPDTHISIDARIDRLTTPQKAALLMLIGLKGKTVTEETREWIRDRGVGSVILFPGNLGSPKEIKKLTQDLQELSPGWPILIAIDQEGGRVRRLKESVTFMPSAMTLGSASAPSLSYLSGMVTAKELAALGINVNLAPVLDIYHSRQDRLIGTRSFGADAEQVATMGQAYVHALQLHSVSATAKHFPGHGDATGDSHFTLPVSTISFDKWKQTQGVPFQHAIDKNVHMLMTAHVRFPNMLKDLGAPQEEMELPASFSPTLLKKVLREQMSYKGLVITDDLEMHAIRKKWPLGEAAVRAILAGSDLVMTAWTASSKEEVYRALVSAIRSQRIPTADVREKLHRILRLKSEKHLFVTLPDNKNVLRHPFHRQTAQLIRRLGLASYKAPKNLHTEGIEQINAFASHGDLLGLLRKNLDPQTSLPIATFGLDEISKIPRMTTPHALHLFFIRNPSDKIQLQRYWGALMDARPESGRIGVVSMDTPRLLVGLEKADLLLCTFNNDSLSLQTISGLLKKGKNALLPSLLSLKDFY